MNKSIQVLMAFCLLFNFSCASIFNGTKETIHLKSDVPGTKLFIDNHEVGTNFVSYDLPKKGLKKVRLYGKKDGCETVMSHIDTSFDPVTLFGLLIDFGLISILVVDWGINGVIYEADRTSYILNPICSAPAIKTGAEAAPQ